MVTLTEKLRAVVGAEHVSTDPDVLAITATRLLLQMRRT